MLYIDIFRLELFKETIIIFEISIIEFFNLQNLR